MMGHLVLFYHEAYFFIMSLFGFKVEAELEVGVDESSARVWFCGTCYLRLSDGLILWQF